jgi:multisubunit Na+/H+ antiporter MnhG subunit
MTIDYTKPPQYPPPPPPNVPGGQLPPPKSNTKKTCGAIAGIGCLVIIVGMVVLIGGIVMFVFGMIKSSDVYKQAVNRAVTNPQVIAMLGTPIETGWWVMGNVNINNDSGHANVTIPLSGPKGSAHLLVRATEDGGTWNYERLIVTSADNAQRVDLLAK